MAVLVLDSFTALSEASPCELVLVEIPVGVKAWVEQSSSDALRR